METAAVDTSRTPDLARLICSASPARHDLDYLIEWAELQHIIKASRVTVWAWRRDGTFPAPLKLGTHKIAWRASEIRAWMDSRERA